MMSPMDNVIQERAEQQISGTVSEDAIIYTDDSVAYKRLEKHAIVKP